MILLGLGSNIGDREATIIAAISRLNDHPAITVREVSALYETAPVGFADQPAFLNAVAAVDTTLTPEALLDACLDVERQLGRVREQKWGPRTIDIDILIYHELVCNSDRLSLPHPLMHQRCFVLVPLREIAPELRLDNSKTASELLETCQATDVKFYKKLEWR
jgi:2-amino-4-hydroxy-6-hydroxymethyldihydropteridine diphosphokinase